MKISLYILGFFLIATFFSCKKEIIVEETPYSCWMVGLDTFCRPIQIDTHSFNGTELNIRPVPNRDDYTFVLAFYREPNIPLVPNFDSFFLTPWPSYNRPDKNHSVYLMVTYRSEFYSYRYQGPTLIDSNWMYHNKEDEYDVITLPPTYFKRKTGPLPYDSFLVSGTFYIPH